MDIGWLVGVLLYPGFAFVSTLALFFEWVDRRLYARMQNRFGPIYTGPYGILQPLADLVKLLTKEDIAPRTVDRALYTLTPFLTLSTSLLATLFLPIAGYEGLLSFEGDLVVVVALLTIICILTFLAGVSSWNRFSVMGAERAAMQLLGYEVPLMLSVIGAGISAGSLSLSGVVRYQASHGWLIAGPGALGLALLVVASQAELERLPFDIPEAEQELVAGWLTEYSGRKLALFRLARDVEMVLLAGLGATLFLGGPHAPLLPEALAPLVFTLKALAVLFLLTLMRAIFARFRIDQMLEVSWRLLIPLAVLYVVIARVMY